MEALRAGDYAKAKVAFEASQTLDPSQTDIQPLLDVATKLGAEVAAKPEPAARAEAPEPEPEPDPTPTRPAPEPAARRARVEPPPPPPPSRRTRAVEAPAPEAGLILVTAEPAGLGVYVDGAPKDLTPTRVEVSPGRHELELRRGNQVVLRKSVSVPSGGVAVVDDDLGEASAPRREGHHRGPRRQRPEGRRQPGPRGPPGPGGGRRHPDPGAAP